MYSPRPIATANQAGALLINHMAAGKRTPVPSAYGLRASRRQTVAAETIASG
jgi:hypothetical protein